MRRSLNLFSYLAVFSVVFAVTASAGSAYVSGDVFAAVGGGIVDEFSPTGSLIQVINDGSGASFTTGMAFDNTGNLFITNFGSTVSKMDNMGNIVNTNFITGQANVESIVFNGSNILVGDASQNVINQYDTNGVLTHSFTGLTTQNRGTDWVDLQSSNTLLYTSEGTSILSLDLTTGLNNANFADGLPGSNAYALRVIPTGSTSAGDVLVADSSNALLLSSSGAILMTYALPGNGGGDFSLNLDPNGTDFWTGDFTTGNIWEVNIATGAIDNTFNSGSGALFGIAVFGEKVIGRAPEPATMSMIGLGLVGLGVLRRRKALRNS